MQGIDDISSKRKKAIIDDVAKLAGISKTTVSRVMNRPQLVQVDTIKKVKTAMKTLDYMPNTVAQSMRSQRSKTIGIVIPDIQNPFYAGMIAEIEKVIRPYDYMLIICPTSGSFEEERAYVSRVIQRNVDGILYFTYNNSQHHIEEILSITEKKEMPIILMDEPDEELHVNQVVTNGYVGVMEATEYLIGKGNTRIACICSKTEAASKRRQGYEDALKKHEISLNRNYIIYSGFSIEDGEEAAERILQMRERPSAVVCVADTIAIGAIRKFVNNDIRVPEDIEVIGFNDSELARLVTPALTSVGQNMPELASQAVELMMHMSSAPARSSTVSIIKVEANLVIRDTTS